MYEGKAVQESNGSTTVQPIKSSVNLPKGGCSEHHVLKNSDWPKITALSFKIGCKNV